MSAAQEPLLPQILDIQGCMRRQPVLGIDQQVKALGEKRPSVEAIPFLVNIRGDGELSLAFFQELDDFPGRSAQQLQFQPFEQAVELEQARGQ